MKVLISVAEGFLLSETSRVVYSPGYDRPDLQKSEHQVLCEIAKLIETRLVQEGVDVVVRCYDNQKFAEFPFDKARHSQGCDAAIFLALNSSQNNEAQFSTCMVHMIQDNYSRSLFEGMMASLQRFSSIPARYPNQMRRTPFLDSCKRKGTPAIIVLPFFYTDKTLTAETLGLATQAAAKSVSEAILCFTPKEAANE